MHNTRATVVNKITTTCAYNIHCSRLQAVSVFFLNPLSETPSPVSQLRRSRARGALSLLNLKKKKRLLAV